MSLLRSQSPLKHRQTHTQSFLPPFSQSRVPYFRKRIEVCCSGSPQCFPVICAGLSGLLQFPEPSAVSPRRSPVLNPNPHGTFSWPTSKSPFTPFFPCKALHCLSCFLSHVAKGAPKPHGSNKTLRFQCTWLSRLGLNPDVNFPGHPHFPLLPNRLHLPAFPYFYSFPGLP